jgi:hypothetical protein
MQFAGKAVFYFLSKERKKCSFLKCTILLSDFRALLHLIMST